MTLFTSGGSGKAGDVGFAVARAPYAFRFPRDHAAHPRYQSEWWYYTGHLSTREGRRFGYELTFFRIGLRPGDPPPARGQSRWRGHEVFAAHLAITDERDDRFVYAEQFAREALGMGSAASERLKVNVAGWTLRGAPFGARDRERMQLHAGAGTFGVDLQQLPLKPPAVHGAGGISRKGSCAACASHYYSYTRLRSTGTLAYGGRNLPVTGLSWMDHEFGSSELEPTQVGWDWFSIQLADGRDLMLYRLRERDGATSPQSSGSLIERNGSVRPLALRGFSITATERWVSPHTGAEYPGGWRIDIPSAGVHVALIPVVRDQELAVDSGSAQGDGLTYWEGDVRVHDSKTGSYAGQGYVELTGYAGRVNL